MNVFVIGRKEHTYVFSSWTAWDVKQKKKKGACPEHELCISGKLKFNYHKNKREHYDYFIEKKMLDYSLTFWDLKQGKGTL